VRKFLDFLQLAGQSIVHRRMRSWLTVIGVFIGITAVVGLMSIGYSLERTINEQVSGLFGTDTFVLLPAGMFGMGPRQSGGQEYALDLDTLKSVDGIKVAAVVRQRTGYVQGPARADGKPLQGFFPVMGLSNEILGEFGAFLGDVEIQAGGRFFAPDEQGVAILGDEIAARFGVAVGDTLLVAGDGADELDVTIVGILKPKAVDDTEGSFASGMGASFGKDTIGVPYETMDLLWGGGEDVLLTLVRTEPGYDVDAVAQQAEEALAQGDSDLSAITYTDISDVIGEMTGAISAFLAGIAGISLLVGGVGVMNTMFTSVLERTKEIGVMKAVGAKNGHVLTIFLIESGMMGLVGGIVGSALGIGLSSAGVALINRFTSGFEMISVVNPWLIVETLIGSFLLGAVAGLWPARRASKLPVVDALRYE
jgi:putative ABC transport system permease protein